MSHNALHLETADTQRVAQALQQAVAHRQQAQAAFEARYPAYTDTHAIDALRASDYARLDDLRHVYLDYTGGGLYGNDQLQQHMHLLQANVYGNPHSSNPTSMAATTLDEAARAYVLAYFNADPDEYTVIFSANASGALRLVGESYPFEVRGQYLLTFDNHNSVNGIREFARAKAAPVTYSPVTVPELRIDAESLLANLDQAIPGGHNLFAFPAQSNFSGVQHPLDWVGIAQEKGWHVLLDAAAYAPTNRLDLSVVKPDFVSLSFYKMFGYPTGVGALIARCSALKVLRRPWFAGGTITVASVQGDSHYLAEDCAAFEDGTIDYLNLPAVEIGLKHMEAIGIETIHTRVKSLTAYLLDELTALHHDNGQPLIKLYGPATTEARGGTLSMNFYDPDGVIFDYRFVEGLANEVNISLRTGCFCNPGAGEMALNIQGAKIAECFANNEQMTFEEFARVMAKDESHDSVGAVRISVGLVTNFADVHTFVEFARSFLNLASAGLLFTDDVPTAQAADALD